MKKIKNRILTAAAMLVAGFGFTSCDIDLLPLNEVVYENFWTNKDDVESVVTACYGQFQNSDVVTRLIVWGEDRSDNVQPGQEMSDDLRFLLKGSIKTTNSFSNWSALYKVINYCNVAMYEAPQVMKKDPNYTESHYRINKAECSFIRDYCYLTLIKTFRDVPFTFEPSLDDTQNYRLPQTKFEDVLDALIEDMESCKGMAPLRNEQKTLKTAKDMDNAQNTGKVTRAAMYALLAELYLWRASDYKLPKAQQNEYYRKCIDCCDWILNYKMERYEAGDVKEAIDQKVYMKYGYPLLAEESVGGSNNGPQATNAIFGDGASFESLFELTFRNPYGNKAYTTNSAVNNMYGTSSRAQYVKGTDELFEGKPSTDGYSDSRLFSVPSDYRCLTSFYYNEEGGVSSIYKYMIDNNRAGDTSGRFGSVGSSFVAATASQTYRDNQPNWILYRLTEIMLFRAEAEIELAYNLENPDQEAEEEPEQEQTDDENVDDEQDNDNSEGDESSDDTEGTRMRKSSAMVYGNSLMTPEELKEDAFNLISAVYCRSNPVVLNQSKDKFAPTMPQTYAAFHKLLMNERRREFLFEGKRFFDLVRASRRAGNTQELREALSTKFSEAGPAVAIKLIQMGFMYMPVFKDEMKINPALVQNECYLDEDENKKQ